MEQSKSMKASLANRRATAKKVVTKLTAKVLANQAAQKKGRGPVAPVMAPFRGVSELDSAPVSIGNTIRSVKQIVKPSMDGVTIVGRDYVMAIGGTSTTYNGWCLQGGMGLSPIALNASGLRGFFQTYEKYKWLRCNAHYITSSPTSLAGDILLVYHSNHGGPKVDHSSSNFLSYALSTQSALIGPQWVNHSVSIIEGKREWYDTDVLNCEDVEHQADGELLVYTKNTTNGSSPDSPGYLLIDYEISFSRRMLNPRVQTLPSSLFKWYPASFNANTGTGQFTVVSGGWTSANTYAGTAGIAPTGVSNGDIFQAVFDTTNVVNPSSMNLASMWCYGLAASGDASTSTYNYNAYPLTNGCTLYIVASGSNFNISPSYEAALAGQSMRWNVNTYTQLTMPMIVCCVGSSSAVYQQANIG